MTMDCTCDEKTLNCNTLMDDSPQGIIVNCRGNLFPVNGKDISLTTKMENGYMYVVIGEGSKASEWEFIGLNPNILPSFIFNCGIREVSTGLYMSPIRVGDKIYLIMREYSEDIIYFNYIYRSGYGADDMRNLKIMNLSNSWNVTSSGNIGDKLELLPNKGDDSSQKFIFQFNEKILEP